MKPNRPARDHTGPIEAESIARGRRRGLTLEQLRDLKDRAEALKAELGIPPERPELRLIQGGEQ